MNFLKISKKFKLSFYIIISIILGAVFGLIFKKHIYGIVDVIATIFLNLLKLITVPLIFTSISTGIISLSNSKNLGRLGLKTISYYISSSLIAIITGLTLTNIIKPGVGSELSTLIKPTNNLNIEAISFREIVIRMFPPNIFQALAKGEMLPIIIFSIIVGFFISRTTTKNRIFLSRLLESGFELMMNITEFILKLAPIGIFGIVAKIVCTTGLDIFSNLAKYFLTVLTGLFIHYFISLPIIIYLLTKLNPYKHMVNMAPSLLTAFSTASSSATLPLTLECAEVNSGISNNISSFVFPLGATINMDGTALYECSAAIFISQVYGLDLSFIQQFVIIFTALLASIGAAGIPMAGLVMLVIVLRSVGLPTEGIGIILAVDRILDMIRTSTNVWSDSTGAIIIAETENEIDKEIFNN